MSPSNSALNDERISEIFNDCLFNDANDEKSKCIEVAIPVSDETVTHRLHLDRLHTYYDALPSMYAEIMARGSVSGVELISGALSRMWMSVLMIAIVQKPPITAIVKNRLNILFIHCLFDFSQDDERERFEVTVPGGDEAVAYTFHLGRLKINRKAIVIMSAKELSEYGVSPHLTALREAVFRLSEIENPASAR